MAIATTNCPKCGRVNELPACGNCGGVDFRKGALSDGSTGMICKACNLGFSYTPCQAGCGAQVSAISFGTTGSRFAERVKQGIDANQGTQSGQGSQCFIATELYGRDSVQVATLRQFRDHRLLTSRMGARLVVTYYRHSPSVIPVMRRSMAVRAVLRVLVELSVRIAKASLALEQERRTSQTRRHLDFRLHDRR